VTPTGEPVAAEGVVVVVVAVVVVVVVVAEAMMLCDNADRGTSGIKEVEIGGSGATRVGGGYRAMKDSTSRCLGDGCSVREGLALIDGAADGDAWAGGASSSVSSVSSVSACAKTRSYQDKQSSRRYLSCHRSKATCYRHGTDRSRSIN